MTRVFAAGWMLLATVPLTACASSGVPQGPVRSPTGIVYELGAPPVETRYSQTAALYLRTGDDTQALRQAQEGIASDTTNAVHYYLAGLALVRLGRLGEADRMLRRAEDIYPAYELDIEPEREAAWTRAFNEGLEAYQRGATEDAVEAWLGATRIFELQPAAHRNVASLLVELNRDEEAIEIYRSALCGLGRRPATRVLDDAEVERREELRADTEERLAQLLVRTDRHAEAEPLLRAQLGRNPASVRVRSDLAATLDELGRATEARALYGSLLSDDALGSTQLFNLGVALFRSSRFEEAGRAFERLTLRQPDSRDAWFNYANALFAAEAWPALVAAGTRLIDLDPLNNDAHLITARARLETGDREGALRGLAAADAAPVHLTGLRLRVTGPETVVQGRLVGNALEAGTALGLRFTFYDDTRPIGSRTLSLEAPRPGDGHEIEVTIEGRAVAYRYEVLADPAR